MLFDLHLFSSTVLTAKYLLVLSLTKNCAPANLVPAPSVLQTFVHE